MVRLRMWTLSHYLVLKFVFVLMRHSHIPLPLATSQASGAAGDSGSAEFGSGQVRQSFKLPSYRHPSALVDG